MSPPTTTTTNTQKGAVQMKTAAQTDLFSSSTKPQPKEPKKYTVQKYRLSYVKEPTPIKIKVCSRADVRDFCKQYLSPLPIEKVCIIGLDNGNNIIGYEAFEGATNQCVVYPSVVFRFLLSTAASSFIIAHNHPGGNTNPSEADWKITERLQNAGKMLEIPLLDHLIITENDSVSLREHSRWSRN